MSPFKRTERAAAKRRARGSHAKPGGPVYPLMRTPVAQLLANPTMPGAEVPVELQSREYEFPRVELPDVRPLVSADELLAAMAADERPTQPIDMRPVLAGLVLDEQPRPAAHEGLAPAAAPNIPVPSIPFLNAGATQFVHRAVTDPGGWHTVREVWRTGCGTSAPRGECAEDDSAVTCPACRAVWEQPELDEAPTQEIPRVDSALPARLTDVELMLLGRPIPADAPAAVRRPAPVAPGPQRRDAAHPFAFAAFDDEFWELVNTTARQWEAGPGGLRMGTDAAMDALDAHLAAVEAAHRTQIERGTGVEYAVWLASQLADADRPLPHRTPGAALLAIEASRGELVPR